MDIITHALSGVAAGTVIANLPKINIKKKIGLMSIGGLGGIIPDIDAISLWSKFDSTIGQFFGLTLSGKEIYSAKLWYSHHSFMHSLFGCLICGLLLAFLWYFIQTHFKNISIKNFFNSINTNKLFIISFIVGFIVHLLEDLPTPSSSWGGINLLWPLNIYIGGTGEIWWWNNYDIFLFVTLVIVINLILLISQYLYKFNSFKYSLSIFIIGFIFIVFQIKNRDFDFNYVGKTTKFDFYEQKSKEIQKNILGENLYYIINEFDKRVKVNF